jgi:hypothetical protein
MPSPAPRPDLIHRVDTPDRRSGESICVPGLTRIATWTYVLGAREDAADGLPAASRARVVWGCQYSQYERIHPAPSVAHEQYTVSCFYAGSS